MKTVVVPEACKGEDAKYSGSVEMRPPFIEERWEYLESCGLMSEIGKEGQEEKVKEDALSLSRTIVKVLLPQLPKHVMKVDLVEKASGQKIESLDELRADPDAGSILIELASMLLKGFKPSKN